MPASSSTQPAGHNTRMPATQQFFSAALPVQPDWRNCFHCALVHGWNVSISTSCSSTSPTSPIGLAVFPHAAFLSFMPQISSDIVRGIRDMVSSNIAFLLHRVISVISICSPVLLYRRSMVERTLISYTGEPAPFNILLHNIT